MRGDLDRDFSRPTSECNALSIEDLASQRASHVESSNLINVDTPSRQAGSVVRRSINACMLEYK